MLTKSVRVQSVKNLRIVINIMNKRGSYNELKKRSWDVTPKTPPKTPPKMAPKLDNLVRKSVRTYDDAQIEKIIRNGGL